MSVHRETSIDVSPLLRQRSGPRTTNVLKSSVGRLLSEMKMTIANSDKRNETLSSSLRESGIRLLRILIAV
jgi:hypothetical protein